MNNPLQMKLPLNERHGTAAFQGALGANSHQACRMTVPQMSVLPCPDFEQTIQAVVDGAADVAVIPIENSSAGRVADMHRLLPDSGLHIIAEHYQPIQHALVAKPGADKATLREVFSHEQALSQCRTYLRDHGLEARKFSDTAAAAAWIADAGQAHQAAICPALAAEIYDLQIIEAPINDHAQNTTRFVILAKQPETPSMDQPAVTSLLFRTRSEPASLYKALTSFATLGINITKLESYLIGDRFDVAQFYIDVIAHQDSEAFKIALRDLRYFCVEDGVRVMGCYAAHGFRRGLRLPTL